MSFPCGDPVEAWTDDAVVICPPPSPSPPPFSPSVLSFEGPLFSPEADSRNLFRACVLLLLLLLLRCFVLFLKTRDRLRESQEVIKQYTELATLARDAQASRDSLDASVAKMASPSSGVKQKQTKERELAEHATRRLERFMEKPEYIRAVEETQADDVLRAQDAAIGNEEGAMGKLQLMLVRFATTGWVRATLFLPQNEPPANAALV